MTCRNAGARLALAVALVVTGACGSEEPDVAAGSSSGGSPWGPLAVADVEVTGGGEALIGEGVLRVGERCTTLETGNGHVVLVWRADQTEWDARQRAISFRGVDGTEVVLHDGDRVVATGGGVGPEGGGSVDFVAAPDASCPAERALVTAVSPVGG